MKKLLTLFFIFAIYCGALAQSQLHSFDLLPNEDVTQFKKLPFDSVVVFDNRFDNRISILGDGTRPLEINEFDSAAKSVKELIMAASKDARSVHQTLYISIKEMRGSNQSSVLFALWVEAFMPTTNGYRRVGCVQRGFSHEREIRDAYIRKDIKKGITKLLEQAADGSLKDTANYNLSYLQENITDFWKTVPILATDTFPELAVYTFWGALRQNKSQPANFAMKKMDDGSFVMIRPDAKHSMNVPDNVYAASYQGQLYFRIIGRYFLPLTRQNGLLYFKIPETIPGMNVLYGMRLIGGDNTAPVTSDFASTFASVLTDNISNLMLKHRTKVYKETREAALKSGQQIEERDCYINLNTGDVIYR